MYHLIQKELDYSKKAILLYDYLKKGQFNKTDLDFFLIEELESIASEVLTEELLLQDGETCELLIDDDLKTRFFDAKKATLHKDKSKADYAQYLIQIINWFQKKDALEAKAFNAKDLLKQYLDLEVDDLSNKYLILFRFYRFLSFEDEEVIDFLRKGLSDDNCLDKAFFRAILNSIHNKEYLRLAQLPHEKQKIKNHSEAQKPWLNLSDLEKLTIFNFLEELANNQNEGYLLGAEVDQFLNFTNNIQINLLLTKYEIPYFRQYLAYTGHLLLRFIEDPFPLSRLVKILPEIWLEYNCFKDLYIKKLLSFQSFPDVRVRSNLIEGLAPLLKLTNYFETFWPIIEKNLYINHPRLRSTALSIAYQIKPLDSLSALEAGLFAIESIEEYKSFVWLTQNTKDFDQDYSLELEQIKNELNFFDPKNPYSLDGLLPKPNL